VKDQTQANPVFDQLLVGNELHDDGVPGVARWRIICGVNRARQRASLRRMAGLRRTERGTAQKWEERFERSVWRQAAVAVAVLATMVCLTACQASSSIDAAQTAIVAAQTVLPGAQATAQAGATLVSIAVANAQPVVATLQAMLQGVSVQVKITPEDAQPDAVTNVSIEGIDAQNRLSQVDTLTRNAAATAALAAAQQYYPKATISLKVSDASGASLLQGSVAPGQTPNLQ
jgi:hypothetical protein